MQVPDNEANAGLDDAPEMAASDMDELFSDVEDSSGSGEQEESVSDEDAGQGDSDSDTDSDTDESEDSAEDESGESEDAEPESEDEDESDEESEEAESEEPGEDDESEESEDDAPEPDAPEPDAESIKQAHESYKAEHEAVLNRVAQHFAPEAQAAKEAREAAEAELAEIEKKYKEPDEDGYVRENVSLADQRRVVQLENQIADANRAWKDVTGRFGQEVEKTQHELMIQSNLKAFPKLAQVEAGFREALQRGYKFSSPAEAIEVSAGLMRAKGLGPKPSKTAKKPAGPKPKPGDLEKAALEASIANKKKGAITAGKGSTGSKGAAAKTNPYKGLSHEERGLMEYFDKAFPEGR